LQKNNGDMSLTSNAATTTISRQQITYLLSSHYTTRDFNIKNMKFKKPKTESMTYNEWY